MVQIREARVDDVDKVIELVEEFYNESLSSYGLVLGIEKFKLIAYSVIHSSFVLEDEGKIVGVISLRITNCAADKGNMAEELVWYVSKPYRGLYGIKLLTKAENYCKAINVKIMTVTHMGNINNRLFKIYKRRGFNLMQSTYSKEL